jgi:hypothetical protein
VLTAPNGMAPDVSISYSANRANGLLGAGWGLAFESSIERKSKPYAVNQEDTLATAASAIQAMDVAIIGAPLTPETNGGQLDYGRAVMMDGANLVTTTSSTRKVMVPDAPLYTEYATIAVYDASFTPIAVRTSAMRSTRSMAARPFCSTASSMRRPARTTSRAKVT